MDGNGTAAARAADFWNGLPHQVVAHDRWAVELAFAEVHPEGRHREYQINSLLSVVSLRAVELAGAFDRLERMGPEEAERTLDALAAVALDEENGFVTLLARDWEQRSMVFEISCGALAAHLEVVRYRAASNAKLLGLDWPADAWVAGMYRRAYAHVERSGVFWCNPLPRGIVPGGFMTSAGEAAVREFFRVGDRDGRPLPRPEEKGDRKGNVTYAFGAAPVAAGTAAKARDLLDGKVFSDEGGK